MITSFATRKRSSNVPKPDCLALASACVAVGLLLANIGRVAIAQHDASLLASETIAGGEPAESAPPG